MPSKKWDTWELQRRLETNIEWKDRYRNEHVGRVNRGQGNGSVATRDYTAGEVSAYEALLGGALYPKAQDMRNKIADLLTKPAKSSLYKIDRKESYTQGWRAGLEEVLGWIEEYK